MNKDLRKKSQLAWGLSVICATFLLETWNADRIMPNRASPLIWIVLGLAAADCAGLALWLGFKARRSGSAD